MYEAKVRFLRSSLGHRLARRWNEYRTTVPRARETVDYMTGRIEGRSFADIGCMWKINGEHSFLAESRGATRVVAVDIWKTDEFDRQVHTRDSKVEFVVADATEPGILSKAVGPVDVVWCFGVLYHVPDPMQLLRNLRDICLKELILETFTIPEIPGSPQSAVFFPHLDARHQRIWRDPSRAAGLAISKEFDDTAGYVNNFWGLTPSALRAAMRVAGFEVQHVEPSLHGTLRSVVFATPTSQPQR